MRHLTLALSLGLCALSSPAQEAAAATASPSTLAYQAANHAMHAGMDIAFTGNADYDFIVGMIPHHQGAIDMAKIQLQYGQDERVRNLAQAVIDAQEAEIAQMQAWQAEMEAANPTLKAAVADTASQATDTMEATEATEADAAANNDHHAH